MLNNGKKYQKILCLPDTHFPFADWDVIRQAQKWAKIHKPDLIIQLGDILDQKAWSRWPKDVDDYGPQLEWEYAEADMERLSKIFPKMHILTGNHDTRIMMKAAEAGLPRYVVRELGELFPYPGWEWHLKPKEKLIVNSDAGPILFLHGDEMAGNAVQIARRLGINVVMGHTHQFLCGSTSTFETSVFGMECGAAIDAESKGARYAARNPVGFAKGFAVIAHGVPYFVKKGLPIK